MKFGRNDKTPTISQSREGGQKNTATLGTDYRFLGRLRREKPEPNHTLYEERERERAKSFKVVGARNTNKRYLREISYAFDANRTRKKRACWK